MGADVLLLPDPLAGLVESVGADDAHGEEVVGRAETARGDVALETGVSFCFFCQSIAWRWT